MFSNVLFDFTTRDALWNVGSKPYTELIVTQTKFILILDEFDWTRWGAKKLWISVHRVKNRFSLSLIQCVFKWVSLNIHKIGETFTDTEANWAIFNFTSKLKDARGDNDDYGDDEIENIAGNVHLEQK